MKRLCFELIAPMDGEGYMNQMILSCPEEDLLRIIKDPTRSDYAVARMEFLHRNSMYLYNRTEDLISISEDYLNGKQYTSIKTPDEIVPAERLISIDSALIELEYRGIRVLNMEYSIPDLNSTPGSEPGVLDILPNTLEYFLDLETPPAPSVKGRFVYKNLGKKYPLRNGKITFSWYGSGAKSITNISATENDGSFSDSSSNSMTISTLRITVAKGKFNEVLTFNISEIYQKDGDLGEIVLTKNYAEFEGLFEHIDNLTTNMENVVNEEEKSSPSITLSNGKDLFVLSAGNVPSNYTYKILHRLVAPGVIGTGILESEWDSKLQTPCPSFERVPVDRPIDVDLFKQKTNKCPRYQARMGSLGIGYILSMQQEWRPTDFSLGTLLYSVALAPGEEQRIVVKERSESYDVTDSESLLADTDESSLSDQDTSSGALFDRALDEQTRGSTNSRSVTSGTSAGALGGLFASGSTTNNKADSESNQNASRDQTSSLSQNFNENLARQADKQREANRIGIRMATSEESSSVTSKIIANRNHSHSLTMQYWEVMKNYIISTRIAGVNLVCYIPLELIPFLPSNHEHIIDPTKLLEKATYQGVSGVKQFFYERYETVLKHYDALYSYMSWNHRNGLSLMKKYASYQDWDFQNPNSNQPEKLVLTIKVGILSYQKITAQIRLKGYKGLITGYLSTDTPYPAKESHTENTSYDLMNFLEKKKEESVRTLKFKFDIPPGIKNDDFDWLEIKNASARSTSYPVYRSNEDIKAIENLIKNNKEYLDAADDLSWFLSRKALDKLILSRVHKASKIDDVILLTSRQLNDIGPPIIKGVKLENEKTSVKLINRESGRGEAELHSTLMYSIFDDRPTMSFLELQQIEQAFQHIIENSIEYSQAVWKSLSSEERAMLFERYTVAIPAAAGEDIGADVPLSNCIENKVEGFYGNCMIVPFSFPPEVADRISTTKKVQDALFFYHTKTFRSPEMKISLSTGGMIGEAVLGGSNASEKIDITRFWKWEDSPIDPAPTIDLDKLAEISLLSDAIAPDALLKLQQKLTLGEIGATALPNNVEELSVEGKAFHDVTNMQGMSDHITTIAERAADERMNAVNQSTAVAKTAIKAAAAVGSGGATVAAEAAAGAASKAGGGESGEKTEKGGK